MSKKRKTKVESTPLLEWMKAVGPFFNGIAQLLRMCIEHRHRIEEVIATLITMMT